LRNFISPQAAQTCGDEICQAARTSPQQKFIAMKFYPRDIPAAQMRYEKLNLTPQ